MFPLMSHGSIQVTGRNIWIFALIDSEPRMQTKPVVFYLFMTYSVIEIFRLRQLIFLVKNRRQTDQVPLLFRYPYYLLSINGHSFGLLTWFR